MAEFKLSELAEKVNGRVEGKGDPLIRGAAKIDDASENDITFLANPKYKDALSATRAAAVVVGPDIVLEKDIPKIRVDDAYFRFLQIFLLFHPQKSPIEPGIHKTAVIDPSADIGENAAIGPHAVIGKNCRIGKNARILPNCVIMDNVEIGDHCLFYPLVSVRENCRIGHRVIIHNGAVIGSDGFGFAPHEGVFHKIPQVGRVVLEDEVEIGANCTIDRATMGETVIRKGCKLDNLVHIAHNVEVGSFTVIAAQTGISGSTKIGHHVMMGGQVGTVGHITIGNFAQIGAQSGVSKSVPEKEVMFGYPARPIMRTKRIEAVVNQLPELLKRIKTLENQLKELKAPKKENEE
ncbi:MAG: UDP-3-O-(3-hydroxymyristoyl)glucosamine N-acyltransferase [Calditrichia bacterium]